MRALFESLPVPDGEIVLCKTRRDPAFGFAWHHHREFELTLITASRGRRFVGDHIAEYQSGDLVLLGPNLPHSWASGAEHRGRHTAVVIQFEADVFGKGGVPGLAAGPFSRLMRRAGRGVAFSGGDARSIGARVEALPAMSPVRRLGSLLVILDDLAQSDASQTLSSQTVVPDFGLTGRHPIDRVCGYVNAHFRAPIALAAAAAEQGMSESAFCRFFKRTTGRTFTRYVNEIRIAHACRLLIETERSIADIAEDSGFTNLSHFNQRFLAAKNLRPGAFRKAFRMGARVATPTG